MSISVTISDGGGVFPSFLRIYIIINDRLKEEVELTVGIRGED